MPERNMRYGAGRPRCEVFACVQYMAREAEHPRVSGTGITSTVLERGSDCASQVHQISELISSAKRENQ
jgi:hypothetical protein